MKHFFRFFKALVTAFFVFSGLLVAFLVMDSSFNISKKVEWFPVIALTLPVICAATSAVLVLRKHPPRVKPTQEKQLPKRPTQPVEPVPPEKRTIIELVDEMEGTEFEQFCAALLEDLGYQQIHVTKSTGDQGVDIIAIRNGMRWAFQCKRYASKIGNAAVQQVNTGKMLYSCQKAVVITNNYFTSGAVKAAKVVGVELWDRDVLSDKIARIAKATAAP